ncbi:uncharacterized protein LOC113291158 [Papaver somniferum]|uniref:uncharacterized protein LOC113291158 n=1 Tax=Papaver somniferum TaxID=3469 RepID=UPI000E7004A1|nr:uncharacterized protein LOC113291158 [Papaver somniferum]
MGHDYTENLKSVNESVTSLAKTVDDFIKAMATQKLEEQESNKTKAVDKRHQREEERVARKQELKENNIVLTTALTTTITSALTTQLTQTTTTINTQLAASLRSVFSDYMPQLNQNNGHDAPPPPPPTGGQPIPARSNTINLKFPTFDGDDLDGWIFTADKYFSVHQADDALKITIDASSLKGDANVWYRWKQTKVTIVTWLEFFAHLRARFAPEKFVDARLAISTINQVDDYLTSCFIRSLKPHIGSVVKLLAPQTLNESFTKAIHQEEAYATVNKFNTRQPYRTPPLRSDASTSTTPIKKLTLPPGYKKLTWEEMKENARKMHPTSVEDVFEVEDITDDQQIHEDPPTQESSPAISLNSLLGSTFPNTMRITGYAKARPLTILLDSVSTHNFLHPSIAKKCGFVVSSTTDALRVTVGNGGHLETKGICTIPINLQGTFFHIDFHLLDISGCDAVLGIQWLRTLGDITWDFGKLTMQFSIQDTIITLTGNQSSSIMIMDVSPMQRLLSTENYGFLLELVTLNTFTAKQSLSPGIQQLLSNFSDIFSTPTSLPPERVQDHKISLLPETGPVNVRPCRYPHFQKDEIEKS